MPTLFLAGYCSWFASQCLVQIYYMLLKVLCLFKIILNLYVYFDVCVITMPIPIQYYGLDLRKTLFGFANYKGADQLVNPCRLISAFVILFWKSMISKPATCEMSIIEKTDFCRALSETQKTCFLESRVII